MIHKTYCYIWGENICTKSQENHVYFGLCFRKIHLQLQFKSVNQSVTLPLLMLLSHNTPCFQCNITITNFPVSNTCEVRSHNVIGQSTVPMYSYAKIPKHGSLTWQK